MGKHLVLIGLASFLLALLPASAVAEVEGKSVGISQEVYDENGDPYLFAYRNGPSELEWARCLPFAACEVISGGGAVRPGMTPAGTTFRLSNNLAGYEEVVTSHPWGGRLTLTQPPTISGKRKVMSRITGNPGAWTGGWPGDKDAVTVFACKLRSSKHCDVVTGAWYASGSEPVDLPIGEFYAGWKLFVVNYRNELDAIYPAIGYGRTRVNPLNSPRVTTAISAVGRVSANSEYSVKLFKRSRVDRSGRMPLARVKCPTVCRVRVDGSFPAATPFSAAAPYQTIHRSGIVRGSRTFFPGKRANPTIYIKGALMAAGSVLVSD